MPVSLKALRTDQSQRLQPANCHSEIKFENLLVKAITIKYIFINPIYMNKSFDQIFCNTCEQSSY